jgi:hypothetical protein
MNILKSLYNRLLKRKPEVNVNTYLIINNGFGVLQTDPVIQMSCSFTQKGNASETKTVGFVPEAKLDQYLEVMKRNIETEIESYEESPSAYEIIEYIDSTGEQSSYTPDDAGIDDLFEKIKREYTENLESKQQQMTYRP